MKYLVTYDDAQKICRYYNNFNFSEHMWRIGNYKISAFDYFICGYNHFANPLPNEPNITAFDMRGVTFVFNEDGTIFNRYLMLPKFFNINQIEETQYDKVKDKNIVHISSKEDGSLVAFMMLPNGKLFAKTIRGFDNDQVISSQQILFAWEDHTKWVKKQLEDGFTPLFEYVSYANRIVLKYGSPELRFIGLRNNSNGDYIPASKVSDIPSTMYFIKNESFTLDELIEKSKVEEDKEGWVVIFDDDMLLKVKTQWYFTVHGLRTMNVFREDYVIENYYKETLDDLVSQLNPIEDKDAFDFIDKVTKAIDNYAAHIDSKVEALFNRFLIEFNGDFAKFATACHKEIYFDFMRAYIDDKNKYKNKKVQFILEKTYRLNKAKEIVEKYKT